MTEKERTPDKGVKRKPLVSVVMATYNGERFLREQLDSIIQQSYQNLEIIIQDDGSTDATLSILHEYESKDARIRVIKNQSNFGINKNFYDLIDKTSGDYIAISDQDDIWLLKKIETLLQNIGKNSLIYTDSLLINAQGEPTDKSLLETLELAPKTGHLLTDLLTANTISGHACLFSSNLKNLIKKVSANANMYRYVYDQVIATLASFQDGINYIPDPLTHHRLHENNNCNKLEQKKGHSQKEHSQKEHFFRRKKRRVTKKINRAWRRAVFFSALFDTFSGEKNPYKSAHFSKKTFRNNIISANLYFALLRQGLPHRRALEMSLCSKYYSLFRFF